MAKEIVVTDLDGTLIESDVTWEDLFRAFIQYPLKVILLFFRSQGRLNHFKESLLREVDLPFSVETLPYNQGVLDYLKEMKQKGHTLVLATASYTQRANQVASYLGLFDRVFASDATVNLKSENKAQALVQAYGARNFIYLGNSKDDLAVWRVSQKAVCVNCSPRLFQQVECADKEHFSERPSFFGESIRLLRVYQWVKNTLIFLPLISAHRIFEGPLLLKTGVGFICFSFVASALYILNDLVDLENDRSHPRKKNRPLAAGSLQTPQALALFAGLFILGTTLSFWVGGLAFFGAVLLYGATSFTYSVALKKYALVDVLILSSLFVGRIFAGQILGDVPLTHWFMLFFGFIFFSLALAKRYGEFTNTQKKALSGRGYQAADLPFLMSLGTGSVLISLVVFGIYINTPQVMALYRAPVYLWGAMPVLLYGLAFIWLSAGRGALHDDPILFIFKKRRMYLLGAIVLGCTLLAKG